jgi:hypothetical protein
VVAAVVAVLGAPVTVYGVVLARRATVAPRPGNDTGREVRQKIRSGGNATVAGGDLHLGSDLRGQGPPPDARARVQQDVRAERDAFVAGCDLHTTRRADER